MPFLRLRFRRCLWLGDGRWRRLISAGRVGFLNVQRQIEPARFQSGQGRFNHPAHEAADGSTLPFRSRLHPLFDFRASSVAN